MKCSMLERWFYILCRYKMFTKVNELVRSSTQIVQSKENFHQLMVHWIHICRAHSISMIWRKASENYSCLSGPSTFGWTINTGSSHVSPVCCLNPPAPKAVLHIIKCGCRRGCEIKCSCCKNNISCTKLCGSRVFGCNNEAIQPGINEDFEYWDVTCIFYDIHEY